MNLSSDPALAWRRSSSHIPMVASPTLMCPSPTGRLLPDASHNDMRVSSAARGSRSTPNMHLWAMARRSRAPYLPGGASPTSSRREASSGRPASVAAAQPAMTSSASMRNLPLPAVGSSTRRSNISAMVPAASWRSSSTG